MKPVMRDKFGVGGNCLSACIASLMHLTIDDVPNFNDGTNNNPDQNDPTSVRIFWRNVDNFLESKGYAILHFEPGDESIHDLISATSGHFLVGGKSPRGYYHSVIYTKKGLAHDPHPEGGGVVAESISIIYPLFN